MCYRWLQTDPDWTTMAERAHINIEIRVAMTLSTGREHTVVVPPCVACERSAFV